MSQTPVIAVDGPSGAGKGTLCAKLADHLGWHLLDSGAIYRVMALAALNSGLDVTDETAVVKCAHASQIDFKTKAGESTVRAFLDNQEVTEEIRKEGVGLAASKLAVFPLVRLALLQKQQDFQRSPGLIADGRDMGTVVFPDATLKIFLTASAETRAKRRFLELQNKGVSVNLPEVLARLKSRDERDANRLIAPLKPASDSIVVDTSELDAQAVFTKVVDLVKTRLNAEIKI